MKSHVQIDALACAYFAYVMTFRDVDEHRSPLGAPGPSGMLAVVMAKLHCEYCRELRDGVMRIKCTRFDCDRLRNGMPYNACLRCQALLRCTRCKQRFCGDHLDRLLFDDMSPNELVDAQNKLFCEPCANHETNRHRTRY